MKRIVLNLCVVAAVGLTLHDHVIVSRGGAKSFKNDGLL